jgi:hypothetical protein
MVRDHGDGRAVAALEAAGIATTGSVIGVENEYRARLCTLRATPAKPRPCSPARAASTAAFRGEQIGLERDFVDD